MLWLASLHQSQTRLSRTRVCVRNVETQIRRDVEIGEENNDVSPCFDVQFNSVSNIHLNHLLILSRFFGASLLLLVGPGMSTMSVGRFGTNRRNRNPNWTDAEIVRFLELLQSESSLRDLLANRTKAVFCRIAVQLSEEGTADKTWDQCRVKLKNLKSQYRFVRDRLPHVADLDLEDDDNMRDLVNQCQARGVSPATLKHLRHLRRFLARLNHMRSVGHQGRIVRWPDELVFNEDENNEDSHAESRISLMEPNGAQTQESAGEGSVSPPPSCAPVTLVVDEDEESTSSGSKRSRGAESQQLIERFNQEMMEQFLQHQRLMQSKFARFEADRQRQHELSMEMWRQEAREQEKQMFAVFVKVMSECNAAMNGLVKMRERSADNGRD